MPSFDPNFTRVIGYPYYKLDILLTTLIVFAIVIGLQTVGVVLMSAMVFTPAAAARQWTDKLSFMVILSSFLVLSGCIGVFLSSSISHLPTGPTVVLVVIFVLISLFFAPNRGLFWDWAVNDVIEKTSSCRHDVIEYVIVYGEYYRPLSPHELSALAAVGKASILQTMNDLKNDGCVTHTSDDKWALTKKA